jgi:hypothetical protein
VLGEDLLYVHRWAELWLPELVVLCGWDGHPVAWGGGGGFPPT